MLENCLFKFENKFWANKKANRNEGIKKETWKLFLLVLENHDGNQFSLLFSDSFPLKYQESRDA